MTFKFDTIKSTWLIFFIITGITSLVITLIILLRLDFVTSFLPKILANSIIAPLLLGFVLFFTLARYRKALFWKEQLVSIDESNDTIQLFNKIYELKDLEYYEFRKGSEVTSGVERNVIILKFKGKKGIMIMPCKSSKTIDKYDEFISFFQDYIICLGNVKEKKISNSTRIILLLICSALIVFVCFIWVSKGSEYAFKVLPSIIVFISVASIYILRKK